MKEYKVVQVTRGTGEEKVLVEGLNWKEAQEQKNLVLNTAMSFKIFKYTFEIRQTS